MDLLDITPEHPRFQEFAAVLWDAAEAEWGRHHTAYPTAELAYEWRREAFQAQGWLAVEAGRGVGAVLLEAPLRDNHHLASCEGFGVRPEVQHPSNIAATLLQRAEQWCRDHGRRTVLIETETPLHATNPLADVLERNGYVSAQRCARNVHKLPVSDEVAHHMRTVIGMADGYRIETSVDGLPNEWLDERARLGAMMSTDTPLGDLEIQPETWDADRVRDMFRIDRERGRRVIEAVAWHEATGRMAAFTHVSIPSETPWVAYQDDTLVDHEHRGHRLGYRVKAAVLLLLPKIAPTVEVQRTWNDEMNVHMLRINDELGYEREGTLVEWQKRLN